MLGEFERAAGGVLVGTQMVAKGHDFPDVALSVLVDADSTLRYPDFRAEERTFALVAQLAGRSGRGERGGRVLVQTLAPDADADRRRRPPRRAGLPGRRARAPPGLRLPAVLGPGRARADRPGRGRAAARWRLGSPARSAPGLGEGAELLGPAPRFRRRGRFRRRILIKTPRRRPARRPCVEAALDDALARRASRAGITLAVDVDPQ